MNTMYDHILGLCSQVETPFFWYDGDDITRRIQSFSAQLCNEIEIFYSLKANPNKAIVQLICRDVSGCEVCSMAELETALIAGVRPDSIIFVGPGKSVKEICRCVGAGIKAVVVESLDEIDLVNSCAASQECIQPIAIRVNPSFRANGSKLVMSGRATQFGIDESQMMSAVELAGGMQNVKIIGLHFYMGTRILDHGSIVQNTCQILKLADVVQQGLSVPLEFVDIGGGLGVAYYPGESDLNIDGLAKGLVDAAIDFKASWRSTRIILESGRFLVGFSGVFVTRVLYVKTCKGVTFAVCDGASHCFASAAGIGSAFKRSCKIESLVPRTGEVQRYTVTGPLCTPTDVLGEDVELPMLEAGDLLAVFRAGAYGPTASPVRFLGFGHPAEVLTTKSGSRMIRRPDDVCDILLPQVDVPVECLGLKSAYSPMTSKR